MATDHYIGLRFRAANGYAARHGFHAAFPNFHQARYPNPDRIVYGHFLLRDAVVDWRDVPAVEYRATNARSRFTGAHDYALRVGYQHGFPNWHEANYGKGAVYGTFLIPRGTLQWRDVPTAELGLGNADPARYSMDRWFTGASDYAARHGFVAGMPNGHSAKNGGTWVCGVFLFPSGTAEWRDIRGRDLGIADVQPPQPPPPPKPPKPPQPPQPTTTSFWLDYNPARYSRIGRSQGPWAPTAITGVTNRTIYTIELGRHVNNVVTHHGWISPGATVAIFNGLDATQTWVGTVPNGPTTGAGPIEIRFRYS